MGDASDSAGPQPADARRFAAFISYSHADAAAAAKLQRKLERYRLPRRIADTRATNDASLGPIFRDREDFAAASSLSAAIRDAISQADALVVMCSPDAAASPWVAAEIELFKQLHPSRPILAALLSGEPSISFPAALTAGGNEPLAADLRAGGDGEQLGFLKIVAGIKGVPLDSLIQRDAQRRIRRVTAITATALAAMLIMAIMTTLAFQARNEAARQRAAAEGLVEYMLTDLRANLEGVGSFKVMDAVNARAMEHYRRQGSFANLPTDSLERRARVLHLIGEDLEKRGALDKALASFREAHRVTAALLEQEPERPERIFSHAQSEYWLGHPAELKGDWQTALSQYRAYQTQAAKLIVITPENPDYMMELGWSHQNIGIVELKSRVGPEFGRRNFETAIRWMERVARLKPSDNAIKGHLGEAYAWLADSYYLRKDFSHSIAARRKELKQKSALSASDPSNTTFRFGIAKAQYALGYNLAMTGKIIEAHQLFAVSEREMAKLLNIESENEEWKTVSSNIDKAKRKFGRHK